MIKKISMALFFMLIAAAFSGCGEKVIINGRSYRALSKAEEEQMLLFARLTLTNSSDKISFVIDPLVTKPGPSTPREKNLTESQKKFIMTTMPQIQISYTGNKSGKASYEWIYNDQIMFRVNCEGEFLTESMRVNTRKMNLKEIIGAGKTPVLEKLTFKEIK